MSYFIYVNGMRVPVSKEVYSEYWRLTNRENYLNRLEIQYRVRPFSDYADDQLTNIMADEKMNIEKITETKEILQLLYESLNALIERIEVDVDKTVTVTFNCRIGGDEHD